MSRLYQRVLLVITLCTLLLSTPLMALSQTQVSPPSIKTPIGLVIDASNGQILYQESSEDLVEVSDLTKILVLYLIYQEIKDGNINFNSEVSISDAAYALSQDYSIENVPLRQDETYTVKELLRAVAIEEANGACLALSEFVAGSEENFLDLMKKQLTDWGVDSYELYNVTGLPNQYNPLDSATRNQGEVNKLTSETLAIAAYHLLKIAPDIVKETQVSRELFRAGTSDAFEMTNLNDMLKSGDFSYGGVDGLMVSGSTSKKHHFLATAEQNGFRLITVVLGGREENDHFISTKQLLDYVYTNFEQVKVISKGHPVASIGQVDIANGRQSSTILMYQNELKCTVPLSDISPQVDYHYHPIEQYYNQHQQLVAPISKNVIVGKMEVTMKGLALNYLPTTQANISNVVVNPGIQEGTWYLKLWRMISRLFSQTWNTIRSFFINIFN